MSVAQIVVGLLVVLFVVLIGWDLFKGDIDDGKF